MKFGQLIDYYMRHTQNVVEKLVPDPPIKSQN